MSWMRLLILFAAGGAGFWYLKPTEERPKTFDPNLAKNRQAMIRHYERLSSDIHERMKRSIVSKADKQKLAEYHKKIAELQAEVGQ
jgi:hypothetical protein